MIKVESLKKIFRNNDGDKIVFSEFNLNIDTGERVGLFGANGSGKTTLLNILSGVDKDFVAKTKIDGKRIAYVHQDPYSTLAPWYSCEKNILLAREFHKLAVDQGRMLLKRLCSEFNIDFSLLRYPFAISGGQRQIVSLLRALVVEPDILLLDEPFSALDVDKKSDVVRVLQRHLTSDTSVVISCHRGDEVKTLIDRAMTIGGTPGQVRKDLVAAHFKSREEFEDSVSRIRFQKNESKI